jgi:hypothetical protein
MNINELVKSINANPVPTWDDLEKQLEKEPGVSTPIAECIIRNLKKDYSTPEDAAKDTTKISAILLNCINDPNYGKSDTGLIVGLVIGGIALIAIIIGVYMYWKKKHKK